MSVTQMDSRSVTLMASQWQIVLDALLVAERDRPVPSGEGFAAVLPKIRRAIAIQLAGQEPKT